MTTRGNPAEAAEQGKRDFQANRLDSALGNFQLAARLYSELSDGLNHAEQMSNVAVTLLQQGKAQEALAALEGTDAVFAAAGDRRREGISQNNRGAAMEALHRPEDALVAYERAAELLGEAGEGSLRSEALRAAAALDLRRGRVSASALKMLNSLGANPKPTFLERILKAMLRITR